MLINYAAVIAGLHCLSAVAVPTESSTLGVRGDPKPDDLPLAPAGLDSLRTKEELRAYFDQLGAVWTPPQHNIDARAPPKGLFVGRIYRLAGWVFSVGQVVVEQFGNTVPARLAFPRDDDHISRLANRVADSVLETIGGGKTSHSIGDWTWIGEWLQENYEFNGIPRSVIYNLVYDGIVASTDWITDDNAFDFIIHDANGHALLQFSLLPRIHGEILRYYDEL
ncbi:hypothetical protein NQ176_g4737 [Zarea fungicola]|uniref:Uncharacterized protein n=1 Tax=Zarea fungicola TaxID=93591 RepID=A0ACC1NBX6_9HYPO|nr:hypothetical protein NQ176_g4737 [Lecanicillium fungicola]